MKDQRLYLGHIREAIADIRTYAAAGESAFLTDRMRQDAIIRKLEMIGEAVKQLSDVTRLQRPAIPWRQIAGIGNVLRHSYDIVDDRIIWEIASVHFPALRTVVVEIRSQLPDDD